MSEKMFLKLHKTTLDPDERINNNYINGGSSSDIAFSRKALHQCDADENLFLRFLELDSPAKPASDTQSNQSPTRRASITKPPNPGKTPFTITKTLQRSTDKTFGFSVVWTHPIKIEKVDQGSSADKSGILPGDYIIFIDKYNIVTMPEQDILNLIRTQGDLLILEIFRRPTKLGKMISNSKNTTGNNNQHTYGDDVSIKPLIPLWSSSAYSNTSLETTKRRMQLPQVANSKEVTEMLQMNIWFSDLWVKQNYHFFKFKLVRIMIQSNGIMCKRFPSKYNLLARLFSWGMDISVQPKYFIHAVWRINLIEIF